MRDATEIQTWETIQASYLGICRSLYTFSTNQKEAENTSESIIKMSNGSSITYVKVDNSYYIIDGDIRFYINNHLFQLLIHLTLSLPKNGYIIEPIDIYAGEIQLIDQSQSTLPLSVKIAGTNKLGTEESESYSKRYDTQIEVQDNDSIHFFLHSEDAPSSNQIASILQNADSYLRGLLP